MSGTIRLSLFVMGIAATAVGWWGWGTEIVVFLPVGLLALWCAVFDAVRQSADAP